MCRGITWASPSLSVNTWLKGLPQATPIHVLICLQNWAQCPLSVWPGKTLVDHLFSQLLLCAMVATDWTILHLQFTVISFFWHRLSLKQCSLTFFWSDFCHLPSFDNCMIKNNNNNNNNSNLYAIIYLLEQEWL